MNIREKMLELSYEKVTSKILIGQPKPKVIGMFLDGHFVTGN
jgi:hypothetical protein